MDDTNKRPSRASRHYWEVAPDAPPEKWCPHCQSILPVSEFLVSKGQPSSYCKSCTRKRQKDRYHQLKDTRPWHAAHIRRKYGLTVEEYNAILRSQQDVCAICGGDSGVKGWHVDHDHVTGKIRGVLCGGCNTALGQMKDNPEILRAAADYVEKHR